MKIRLATLLGFLSVVMGAFGAHALKERLGVTELEWWKTATQYLLPHALLMLAIALNEKRWPKPTFWLFFAGAVIFAGSLYTMSLTGIRILGAITPIGGALLLVGWATLFFSAGRLDPNRA